MPKQRIGDIDLYYESIGQGEPILFIHGLGSSTRDWEKQAEFFFKNHQVVTFDVRGHGQSDKPSGPYTMSLFAEDTAELIKELDIVPTHVAGISMGGMIAFQLALNAPDLVKSLVIVNSTPEYFVHGIKVLLRRVIVRLLGMRQLAKKPSKGLFPKPEQEALRQEFLERWSENDTNAYLSSMQAIVGWSVMDQLSEIRCPTLVVTADEDYSPTEFKEAYAAKMPRAELVVIKDSRHLTPLDQPDRFNKVVMTFLSEQGRLTI